MGYQKHYHTYMDGDHGYDHFPTINHIFGACFVALSLAAKSYKKRLAKMEEEVEEETEE